MMVRIDLLRQLGGFDPTFDPFGPEDLDFSLRLRQAGHYALYLPQAMAFHEVSHSFEGGQYTQNYARHKARNWFVFLRRCVRLIEQVGFIVVGAPYRIVRMLIREGSKGNLADLSGILRGFLEFWRSWAPLAR
jgi:GT2 family glycosyltransferase